MATAIYVNIISGPNGRDGKDGRDGATGATGCDGICRCVQNSGVLGGLGIMSMNNPDVSKGATGNTGNTGNDGKDGARGATGNDGKDGQNGAQGNTGNTGATGNNGADGKDGARGATGATGTSGAMVYRFTSSSLVAANGITGATTYLSPTGQSTSTTYSYLIDSDQLLTAPQMFASVAGTTSESGVSWKGEVFYYRAGVWNSTGIFATLPVGSQVPSVATGSFSALKDDVITVYIHGSVGNVGAVILFNVKGN